MLSFGILNSAKPSSSLSPNRVYNWSMRSCCLCVMWFVRQRPKQQCSGQYFCCVLSLVFLSLPLRETKKAKNTSLSIYLVYEAMKRNLCITKEYHPPHLFQALESAAVHDAAVFFPLPCRKQKISVRSPEARTCDRYPGACIAITRALFRTTCQWDRY